MSGFLSKTNLQNKNNINNIFDQNKISYINNKTNITCLNKNKDSPSKLIEKTNLINPATRNSKNTSTLTLKNISNSVEKIENRDAIKDNKTINNIANNNLNENELTGNYNKSSMNNSNNINSRNCNSTQKNKFTSTISISNDPIIPNNPTIDNSNININLKDSYLVNKGENDFTYRIDSELFNLDSKSEKNKFLETVYDRLNNKNTSNIKEVIVDYCLKYLNYSYEEIQTLLAKYLFLFIIK